MLKQAKASKMRDPDLQLPQREYLNFCRILGHMRNSIGWGLSHLLHSDGKCVHVCFGDFACLSFNNHHSISPRNKVYFYQSIRPTVFIYVIVMFFGSSALKNLPFFMTLNFAMTGATPSSAKLVSFPESKA